MNWHKGIFSSRIGRIQGFQDGYSLVEVTIGLGLSLLIMAAVYSAFVSSLNIWRVQTDSVEQQDNARLSLNKMAREVRQAYTVTTAQANRMDFTIAATAYSDSTPDATGALTTMTVSYALSTSPDGSWYKLMRTVQSGGSSSTSTVGDYIRNANLDDGTSVNTRDLFHYYTSQGVELARPVASPANVARVRLDVFSDIDTAEVPQEAHEATTIAIRKTNFGN